MVLSTCFSHPQIFFKIDPGKMVLKHQHKLQLQGRFTVSLQGLSIELFGQCVPQVPAKQSTEWSFCGGYRIAASPNVGRASLSKKRSRICSCWMVGSQLASTAFTLGTVAVLPFYTLMVVAPKAKITKKAMDSSLPYIVLGLVYGYLLYLSWTPDTIRLMFASKYWLPELSGIAKMFSNEMTLASAWIHLLVVDLFAARHVYHDGLENEVETRHSVSLCLLTCPIGILTHAITKALTSRGAGKAPHSH